MEVRVIRPTKLFIKQYNGRQGSIESYSIKIIEYCEP